MLSQVWTWWNDTRMPKQLSRLWYDTRKCCSGGNVGLGIRNVARIDCRTRREESRKKEGWGLELGVRGSRFVKCCSGGRFGLWVRDVARTECRTRIEESWRRMNGLLESWLKRALGCYFTGSLFRTVSKKALVKKATIGDLDTLFHDILRQVQIRFRATLPAHVKIDDEFSVRRSLRTGSTSDAHNQHVPKEVIEANYRWRKHMRSRNVLPSMDMVERYSDAKATVMALVRYSEML